jgi:hypothetical protein
MHGICSPRLPPADTKEFKHLSEVYAAAHGFMSTSPSFRNGGWCGCHGVLAVLHAWHLACTCSVGCTTHGMLCTLRRSTARTRHVVACRLQSLTVAGACSLCRCHQRRSVVPHLRQHAGLVGVREG